MDANHILKELQKEINATLLFFVQTDLNMYGSIRQGTVECFQTQKVPFPEILKDLVQK